jgi:demethylmenaquinone methyltransferase/2-methoxy-6-polyprenyl-1,4-benzoquinol methylase
MTPHNFSFDSSEEKASYVNTMFAGIAARYDLMNRVMSLGRDQAWRRRAIRLAAPPPSGRLLDVATGTGDLALLTREHDPSINIVGADFTIEMMQLGRLKENGRTGASPTIGWTAGDALHLPYPDETFDAVVSGFMMRNVTDIAAAFAEQRRVVRPAGRVVCLEMTHTTIPLWRTVYPWIFGRFMPLITGMLSGQPNAYRYLPASVSNFVNAKELKVIMESVGLRHVDYQTMMLGTVAIHVGVR